jgi:hypothetical protein
VSSCVNVMLQLGPGTHWSSKVLLTKLHTLPFLLMVVLLCEDYAPYLEFCSNRILFGGDWTSCFHLIYDLIIWWLITLAVTSFVKLLDIALEFRIYSCGLLNC